MGSHFQAPVFAEAPAVVEENLPLLPADVRLCPPPLTYRTIRQTVFMTRHYRLTGLFYTSCGANLVAITKKSPSELELTNLMMDWFQANHSQPKRDFLAESIEAGEPSILSLTKWVA
jgi:hypothetical protein